VDSDGNVEALIRPWLEAGVNTLFPVEPGTWDLTPEKVRRKFGREVRIVGGYNKLALERGRDAIRAELERHVELMKTGGLVLMPDHLITPGVPLADYKYYLDLVRNLRL
jgi:uroporphyrinogen decarboxylase